MSRAAGALKSSGHSKGGFNNFIAFPKPKKTSPQASVKKHEAAYDPVSKQSQPTQREETETDETNFYQRLM